MERVKERNRVTERENERYRERGRERKIERENERERARESESESERERERERERESKWDRPREKRIQREQSYFVALMPHMTHCTCYASAGYSRPYLTHYTFRSHTWGRQSRLTLHAASPTQALHPALTPDTYPSRNLGCTPSYQALGHISHVS